MLTRILSTLLFIPLIGLNLGLQAQEPPPPPIIQEIAIEYKGLEHVSREAIEARIDIQAGTPLDHRNIDRSIRSLEATGLFESIFVETKPLDETRVKVVFIVEPKYKIGTIRFDGEGLNAKRLSKKITAQLGDILDEYSIQQDRNTLLEYYQNKGYTQSTVQYNILRNLETGLGEVVFFIERGERYAIRKIEFQGNASIPSKKLRKQIDTTKRKPIISWISGSGRLKEEAFQEDIQKLIDYYKDEGFLDVKIEEEAILIDTHEDDIRVTIPVKEGRQYTMGEVTFDGNTLYSSEELSSLLELQPGLPFSPSKLKQDNEAINNYYGTHGYLDTRVRAERETNLKTGKIDVQYTIKEGDKNYVESIDVIGNTKTKSIVILRELALAPGDVFDMVKMRNSEARLRNTRYFDEVSLSPEQTDLPGRKDLRIEVQEARTGNLTFGAGFSSLEDGVVFVELTQSNFDLFNPKSFFQGDGQKFRLRLQLGSSSNEVAISFEEPWFLEKRLALGTEIFRTESDYVSSEYNELRTGMEIYLRKRIRGLWTGRLSYRLEEIKIFDVDQDEAPPDVLDEEGSRSVSKLGFNLTRDTRDSYLFTTKGNRISFVTQFAGLGGETEYIRLEARGAQFFPLFDKSDHVISTIARAGTLIEYADDKVPFFDRFYLGGPNSLRGFEFREVGPKQQAANGNFEPVGGNSFGFFSVEYNYKLTDPLRLALFYDIGYVNSEENDFNTHDYNDNWGFGLRILILGSPLRLDYGIPINTDRQNDKDGNQFYFSFGTRF